MRIQSTSKNYRNTTTGVEPWPTYLWQEHDENFTESLDVLWQVQGRKHEIINVNFERGIFILKKRKKILWNRAQFSRILKPRIFCRGEEQMRSVWRGGMKHKVCWTLELCFNYAIHSAIKLIAVWWNNSLVCVFCFKCLVRTEVHTHTHTHT